MRVKSFHNNFNQMLILMLNKRKKLVLIITDISKYFLKQFHI